MLKANIILSCGVIMYVNVIYNSHSIDDEGREETYIVITFYIKWYNIIFKYMYMVISRETTKYNAKGIAKKSIVKIVCKNYSNNPRDGRKRRIEEQKKRGTNRNKWTKHANWKTYYQNKSFKKSKTKYMLSKETCFNIKT